MDIKKSFHNNKEVGFTKEEVLIGIEKNAQNVQNGLKIQLDNLTQSRNHLSDEISYFSEHVGELENQLSDQKAKVRELANSRDSLYIALEKKQQELDEAAQQHEEDIAACEKEIAAYLENKKELQKQMESLKKKSQQYDAIQGSLKRIRSKAEYDACKMVEDAKGQSMDAISVVDDIAREVSVFKTDMKQIRNDLTVGIHTVEDRLDSLYYALDSYVQKLNNIKITFYQSNQIPFNAKSYDYMDIANQQRKTEIFHADAADEAAEEQSDGGKEEKLPILKKECSAAQLDGLPRPQSAKTLGEAAEEGSAKDYI